MLRISRSPIKGRYFTVYKGERIELNETLALQAARRGVVAIKTKEIKTNASISRHNKHKPT